MAKYKYTADYIKSVASKYTLLGDFVKENRTLYSYLLNHGLQECISFLERKRGRTKGAIGSKWVGSDRVRKPIDRSDKNKHVRGLLGVYKKVNIGGKWKCGRCFKNDAPNKGNSNVCTTCYGIYWRGHLLGIDTNLGNLKDGFCNIVITEGDEVFKLGCDVDEKLKEYLMMKGYGFIFVGEEDIFNI